MLVFEFAVPPTVLGPKVLVAPLVCLVELTMQAAVLPLAHRVLMGGPMRIAQILVLVAVLCIEIPVLFTVLRIEIPMLSAVLRIEILGRGAVLLMLFMGKAQRSDPEEPDHWNGKERFLQGRFHIESPVF